MNKYKVSRWGSDLSSRKLTDFITSAFRLKSFTELQTDLHFQNTKAHISEEGLVKKISGHSLEKFLQG